MSGNQQSGHGLDDVATDFTVEHADYQGDLDDLRAVREPVFIAEQKVPAELEWDELDPRSHHVIARDLSGKPVGTGRLTPERKIGRMAVLADWRGRGVGAALLLTLIERARSLGYEQVSLHAQVSAISFYRRHGFEAYGDEFDEAGIRHQSMRRALPPSEVVPPRAPEETPPVELLDSSDIEALREGSLKLITQARRRLWIYSRDLDPQILGRPELMEAIRQLALRAEEGGIRLLIQNPGAVRDAEHPLIALSQRLSSVFSLRQPDTEVDLQYPSAFLLNDRGGYLFRPLATRLESSGSTWGRARQQQLLEYFKQVWERAVSCAELRPLQL
ncbi:MAG: GNAT family N-acetyltransferase [Lysobacteraceae bacterium]